MALPNCSQLIEVIKIINYAKEHPRESYEPARLVISAVSLKLLVFSVVENATAATSGDSDLLIARGEATTTARKKQTTKSLENDGRASILEIRPKHNLHKGECDKNRVLVMEKLQQEYSWSTTTLRMTKKIL